MKVNQLILILIVICSGCKSNSSGVNNDLVVTEDVDNFWAAYDQIVTVEDTVQQHQLLQDLFLKKATPGLKAMIEARNYKPHEYLHAINSYPKFWNSIRKNTHKAQSFSTELEEGLGKLKAIYPELKPAKIYFTVGAFRSNGTILDGKVLIGSELAMGDSNTITSEFPEEIQKDRRAFFDTDPIKNLVLLNVHEYVHTQQNPFINNLLSQVIYEGVAEFVSVLAMETPSIAPAVKYGKANPKVKEKFERNMFNMNNRHLWLWSSAPNEFNIRDLGYHIGYEMAEIYYNNAKDKKEAIKKLIELDFENEDEIERYVDGTAFFSKSLGELYDDFDQRRPTIIKMEPFDNHSEGVDPNIKKMEFHFSEALNGYNTGIDYGTLGKDFFPKMDHHRIWSEDNKSWTINVDLEPNKHYQFLVSNNFRMEDGTPLKPLMVEFKTKG